MTFKVCVFFALVAVANCGFIGAPYAAYAPAPTIVKTFAAPAPVVVKKVEVQQPVHYQFQYEVNNPETGDIKSQEETRNGDDVKGSYSLVEPDGLNRRIVEYTASEAGGFNAVVRKEPLTTPVVIKKVIAAPTITKVIAPAPVVHKVVAPAYAW